MIQTPKSVEAFTTRRRFSRRRGGFWEFLILVSFLVAAVIIAQFYFASKKPVAAPAMVQAPPPPVLTPVAPSPAPMAPVRPVMATPPPPAAQSELSVATLPHAPPAMPECKKLEEELRIAREANAAAQVDLDAARKDCVSRLHQSPNYLAAKGEVDAKRQQKDAAAQKLHEDDRAGLDINEDQADLDSASKDWIAAAAKLTQIENDWTANDSQVAEKQRIVAGTSADQQRVEDQLCGEIRKAVLRCAGGDGCAVQAVRLDAARNIVTVELAPTPQEDTGAMADSALRQIGQVLEFVMYKSAFDWNAVLFPVLVDYHGKKAVEFQAEYLRQDVDEANFSVIDRRHFDNLALVKLAVDIWLSPVVDDMQGRRRENVNLPAEPAAYREGPAAASVNESLDTLFIGGYTQRDGSDCPITWVWRTHVEAEAASYTGIIPRRMAMPPLYSKTGLPGAILTQPMDPLIPRN